MGVKSVGHKGNTKSRRGVRMRKIDKVGKREILLGEE